MVAIRSARVTRLAMSPEAHQIQILVWRRMGPEARLRVALELSEALYATARAQIERRHPP